MTQQTHQTTALITGASRGLCLALARELAQRRWSVSFSHLAQARPNF